MTRSNERGIYFLLINEAGVYTKEGDFFVSQGGLKDEWGKSWEVTVATSLDDARQTGIALRRKRYPTCGLTIGE